MKWDPKATNLLFHIFDGPGHGRKFNHIGDPQKFGATSDSFWAAPPPGRADPEEEIRRAFEKLKVQNAIFSSEISKFVMRYFCQSVTYIY